ANIQHVLERERLEVELVARVVIGRDSLGIGVNHDRLKTEFLQRKRGVDTAVIELDSLPDAVWPTTKDDDFLFPRIAPLILVAVSRIIIRRVSLELGGAGIDEAIRRRDAEALTAIADVLRLDAKKVTELHIGKSVLFPNAHRRREPFRALRVSCVCGQSGEKLLRAVFRNLNRFFDNLMDVLKEPAVDFRQLENLLDAPAALEGLRQKENPFRVRHGEFRPQRVIVDFLVRAVAD